jgi:hypothetical protein
MRPMPRGNPLPCLLGAALLASATALADEPVRQWHALPVAGGLDEVARAAGLEAGLPAWRVLYEACRRRHGLWGEDAGSSPADAGSAAREGSVPLPLAPSFWRGLLREGAAIEDDKLAVAIVGDRRAALFYRGVAGLDEETLAALATDLDGLRRLERRYADVVGAFGSRFAVRGGVVVVPGGPEAEVAWQAFVGESPRAPLGFLSRLVEKGEGRLAFLYDSLARLELPRQRLALGLPTAPGADPAEPLRALYKVFAADTAWWRAGHGAFARPDADAARLLREVRLAEDGSLAPPASRTFWAATFDVKTTTAEELRASPRADIAWLASRIGAGDPAWRRLRLEQLAFAQRVFGASAEAQPKEALQALEGLVDLRALVLALERLGSTDPSFYAAVVTGARSALVFQSSDDLGRAHAAFQGALGVIDRARFGGAIDTTAAEGLVRSLVQVPLPSVVPWERGIGGWVAQTLVPTLAKAVGADAADPDQVLVRAMAGVALERPASPVFDWEGLWYRAQPERAELRRLEGVRGRQAGPKLRDVLRDCRDPGEKERHSCAWSVGEALASFVYAAHLGEPDGPALRGEDPARRHAFLPNPWSLPSEVSGPGVPWHVQGSLLGLETALARLSLHRMDADAMPDRAPVIDAAQRRRLSVFAALASALELRDADQHGLAEAVGRGAAARAGARPGKRGSRRGRARRGPRSVACARARVAAGAREGGARGLLLARRAGVPGRAERRALGRLGRA